MTKVRTNLGKVATTPKGEYNSATTYVKLDIVTYNGSSYVCLKESVGNLPTDTEYWQLMASKGDTGAKGQDGYTPVKGVDYFTQEDIASLNIPSKTSDITNDSDFIAKQEVIDLINEKKQILFYDLTNATKKPNTQNQTITNQNDIAYYQQIYIDLVINKYRKNLPTDYLVYIKYNNSQSVMNILYSISYISNSILRLTSINLTELFNPYIHYIQFDGRNIDNIVTALTINPTVRMVTTTRDETISGTKTFTVLPESTIVPTTNNQLTNKSYVDNSISNVVGNINTVLATLTTPSNNGGN